LSIASKGLLASYALASAAFLESEEIMTRIMLRAGLGLATLNAVVLTGCSQVPHQCSCCSRTPTIVSASALPPVKQTDVASLPSVKQTAVTSLPLPQIEVPKRPTGTVFVPVVSCPADGKGGCVTGTLELTLAQADALGIRPGSTPGALFRPGPSTVLTQLPTKSTDVEIKQVSSVEALPEE